MTPLERANAEQRAASDPAVSAFVSASAGSGKTKLLTDRLLRLMLAGTPPAKILCLTYTKAAAAEMAIRLNRRLGQWVALPEAALDAELAGLDVLANQTTRAAARKLFADVLDLPGGMKIGTIHAFCQSLLRRFPLEAELSPHFELEDEFDAAARLRAARELVLAEPNHREAITALAAETNETDFAALTAKFSADEDISALLREFSAAGLAAMQAAALGADERDEAAILAAAVTWPGEPQFHACLCQIADAGNDTGQKFAYSVLDWLAQPPPARAATWRDLCAALFTADGERRKTSRFFGPKLKSRADSLAAIIEAEQNRAAAVENARRAARLAALNRHLMSLAAPILGTDAAAKSAQARVTYADLIAITLNLLRKPENVAWILYKLDGGIDHLLLDEVQDTAPAQWQIADAIAGDFFAGISARDVPRTIFAVGDPKQSIFSFQGADLRSFEDYRAKFRARVLAAEKPWLDGQLSVSFRSTAPVLALVDAVFAAGPACAGLCAPGTLTHGVSRAGQAGSAAFWPLTQPAQAAALPDWDVPDDYASAESGKSILARQIASHIKATLDAGILLPSRNRAATPGDFLVLVRRRDELGIAITRACKREGIPIAGLDRMVLTEQLGVSDLLALCDALLLPEDDLAFGQYLASPLGGLSDESLMHLAIGRPRSLAEALFARRAEQEAFYQANEMFQTLRARVDFISPHALLAEILGPLGGRARILRRLGPEAAEPIDELLAEALAHGRKNPASLQNFLFLLRQSGASIKREAESGGDAVRIMTIHGAKGLQAPIVILPDTTGMPDLRESLFWLRPPQQPHTTVPVYCPRKELRAEAIRDAIAAEKLLLQEEENRLLYVALTRAEDEILVCGAQGAKTPPADCFYNLVKSGFDRLGTTALAAPQTARPDRAESRTIQQKPSLPAWAGAAPGWVATPPAAETTRPESLAPSRSADDPARRAIAASPLGEEIAAARKLREAAMARGRAVHALLQHLPEIPAPDRHAAGAKFLAQPGLSLPPASRTRILESVASILENPTLAPLFGPESRAEVPLAGVVADVEIGGLVDRLAVTDQTIFVADYKTDRAPPTAPEAIPAAYLSQLAAYSAILGDIFPGRAILCTLIWTETATPMAVPPAMLAAHAPQPVQPYAA